MDMVTDMDIMEVVGGDLVFIILPAGVDGMQVRIPMDFMEITFMSIIMYMLTMRIMFTGIAVESPARRPITEITVWP
jgi:hypothetical protein